MSEIHTLGPWYLSKGNTETLRSPIILYLVAWLLYITYIHTPYALDNLQYKVDDDYLCISYMT